MSLVAVESPDTGIDLTTPAEQSRLAYRPEFVWRSIVRSPVPAVAAFVCCLLLGLPASAGVLIDDDFDRTEQDDAKEQVGGDWRTNSKSRAKGNKQVDLVSGAMHIVKHAEADHGVSVTHEAAFDDATIELRFRLENKKDDLGVNIADMNEKGVHAGHICMVRVRPQHVEIHDLKTGRMRLDLRDRRKAGEKLSKEETELIASRTKRIPHELGLGEWHDLRIDLVGNRITVLIDGDEVGSFASEGIDHPTKSRLRIAVNREAWVDDVKVVGTL